jgi:DNA-binding CsgD family transcriptional regulator
MNIKAIILLSGVISLSYVSPIFSQINRDLSPSTDSLLAWANDADLPLPQQFHYAQKAYNIAVENCDTAITFKALIQMYRKKKKLREYGESFTHLQNAYKYAQKVKKVQFEMLALNNLAQFYADIGEPIKVIEKNEELSILAEKNADFYHFYLSKLNLSDFYYNQKNGQKTIEYAESARDNAYKARRYCKGIVLSYINLASGHFLENRYQKTHYFMDSAKMILDTMKQLDKYAMAEVFCLNGRLTLAEGKEQEAISWFQKCVDLKQDCERKARAYLTECYERNGDFTKSAACYREIVRLDSTKLATFESETIKNNASAYQLSEEKRRNETLKNEQFRLYACIPIGFLIVLVFYQRYRNAKTRKFLLETQLEMSKKTLKLQELEQNKLQRTVEAQQEDLKNMAVEFTRKNDFLADLEQKLQSFNTVLDRENVQDLQTLVRQNALNNEQNIVEFKGQVEVLNSIFYERLRQRTPDLSPTEFEICGLIRLNLSSKEIASIRNIEPKSVDMSRYRLRQKLNLKQGEDLTAVLKSI